MPNFFTDNDDIQFHMKNLDLDWVIDLKEDYFSGKNDHNYAPKNHEDAKDSYKRVMEIVGDIAGNFIEPRAAEVDEQEAQFKDGVVTYAKGTAEAIDVLSKAELMGFTLPRKYGGLNCPMTMYSMAIEIVSRADAALMNIFGLQDIAETINHFGDEALKEQFLPRFCSGEVTGSMALTEPDAGSDLQAVNLRAYQDKDGNWFLNGVKRFITNGCGEISLVLARSEDGTTDGRGLSMFVYERDETMKIRRIEHKMGIHGSPTCELQFNDSPAILVGKRKMGLIRYVMSLMNGARLGITAQALGIAEAAYYEAEKYSRERIQFKKAIRTFIPVYEMLANMRMKIEAGRALLYETSIIVDIRDGIEEQIKLHPEKKNDLRDQLKRYTNYAGLFTPMAKAFCTEMCNEVAYDGIQIHGGTGFMREFNAERHARDARITNIYEGTTQLQVVAAIGGIVKGTLMERIHEYEDNFDLSTVPELHKILKEMTLDLEKAITHVKDRDDTQYQEYHARRLVEMANYIVCGYLMTRDATKSERKKAMARYFVDHALPQTKMRSKMILDDTGSILENVDLLLNDPNY
jgi:alkylation response protein AidB-like acyl-CoA dehydrogenase